MRGAALYLRSSKDRSDVSIAAQRRALMELAQTKGLTVVAEYADAVESGKDEDRPRYRALLRDLASRGRTWTAILAYDTSRIGRRRYIADTLRRFAHKAGVALLFVKLPETDPISTVILESVFQAMDEVHSLMSRDKGLAGMAENVSQGFRAGGRAPYGYQLERLTMGTIRQGQPVMKSRLIPNGDAPAIAAYLSARAEGMHGSVAAKRFAIRMTRSGLVDVEWNALTYAGHTVWNMRRPKDGARGGSRRPRAEWKIQRDTHPALITAADAETLLTRLEARGGTCRRRGGAYLLSGLLTAPGGHPWHGDRGRYTTAGGWVTAEELERAVLTHFVGDAAHPAFIASMTEEAIALQTTTIDTAELDAARAALSDIEKRVKRLMEAVERMDDPSPLLRRLDELEHERRAAVERAMRGEEALADARARGSITAEDLRRLLGEIPAAMAGLDRDELKDFLRAWVLRIELDPATRAGRIIYRLSLSRDKVASPQRRHSNPVYWPVRGREFHLPHVKPGRARAWDRFRDGSPPTKVGKLPQ